MKNIFAVALALTVSFSAFASQGDFERQMISNEMHQFLDIASHLKLLNQDGLEAALVELVNLDSISWSKMTDAQKESLVKQVVESVKAQ